MRIGITILLIAMCNMGCAARRVHICDKADILVENKRLERDNESLQNYVDKLELIVGYYQSKERIK